MLKRILMLAFVFAIASTSLFAQSKYTSDQMKNFQKMEFRMKFSDDAIVGQNVKPGVYAKLKYTKSGIDNGVGTYNIESSWVVSVTEILTGAVTIYDMGSNGSAQTIWQDPSTLDNIHVVVTHAPPGDGGTFPNRQIQYYYSSDRGATFTYITRVGTNKGGFGTIDGTSDGNALVGQHTFNTASATTRTLAFIDAFAGLGSFTELDPGLTGSGLAAIWPRLMATNSISLTNKFVNVSSVNGQDTTVWNVSKSLTTSTFTPYTRFEPIADQAETYSMARGSDGRIGIVYGGGTGNTGDVFFTESTTNGDTWSAPVRIYDCNISPTGDSLGMLRGCGIVYQGTSAKVVFETIRQTNEGSFFPGWPARIRFWSPSLPGSDPNRSIVIADSNNVGYYPYVSGGASSDVFGALCRPTIGKSSNGLALFVAIAVPTDYAGGSVDTNAFMSIWLMGSLNNGTTWNAPTRISPYNVSNLRDYTYPSISKVNDVIGNDYYVNIVALKDSVPGTFVNHAANGEGIAKQVLLRVKASMVGINNLSTEVPGSYRLEQNYPNPFNPTTSIRFALPKASVVTMKIYNVAGQLVDVLVNNESVTAGLHEVKFDASKLSSGVYFYTITAGDFKDTKKMILMK